MYTQRLYILSSTMVKKNERNECDTICMLVTMVGTLVAFQDTEHGSATIRTTKCSFLVPDPGSCSVCAKYRQTLYAMLHRKATLSDSGQSNPTGSTNLRCINTLQRVEQIQQLRTCYKRSQTQVEALYA